MCLGSPKVPQPAPVVERQAYKTPAAFDSYSSQTDLDARRRMIAGVVTGSQGDASVASTTKNPQPNQALGGGVANDQIGGGSTSAPGSLLGGGGSAGAALPSPTAPTKLKGGFTLKPIGPGYLRSVATALQAR